jgi:hypothetical protein
MGAEILSPASQRLTLPPKLTRAAEEIEGGGAQETQGTAGVMGLEHLPILPEAVIGDMEERVLNAPMATHEGKQALGTGMIRRQTSDQVVHPLCDLAGRAVDDVSRDLGDLR